MIGENLDLAVQKAVKQDKKFLTFKRMPSRFMPGVAVPYDEDANGLATKAATLEDNALALGMTERNVSFTPPQMQELSATSRRILGMLSYQDFLVEAVHNLIKPVAEKSDSSSTRSRFSCLYEALSRCTNDLIGQSSALLTNLDLARRTSALSSMKLFVPQFKQKALLSKPMMSKHLFGGISDEFKDAIIKEDGTKATTELVKSVAISKASSTAQAQPKKAQAPFKFPAKPVQQRGGPKQKKQKNSNAGKQQRNPPKDAAKQTSFSSRQPPKKSR